MDDGTAGAWDYRVIAAIAAALLIVALGVLHWFDPTRAGAIVTEHGPVEWAQVSLLLAGWVVTTRRAMRLAACASPASSEMLLGALLTLGIGAELSLHSWAGFRIRHWRPSLRRSAGPVLPWVVLVIGLIVGLAVARYLIRHRRALLGVLRSLPHSRWGQLTLAGSAGYAITLLFEHRLARLLSRRSYFLEETIELVSALCLFFAAMQRARAPTGAIDVPETGDHRAFGR